MQLSKLRSRRVETHSRTDQHSSQFTEWLSRSKAALLQRYKPELNAIHRELSDLLFCMFLSQPCDAEVLLSSDALERGGSGDR